MSNVIEIVVRARTSVREGFDAARKEAELAGNDAGESYTDRFVNTVAVRMRERVQAPISRIGKEIGETLGDHTARGVAQVVARGIAAIPGEAEQETETAGREIGDNLGRSAGPRFIQRIREHFRRMPTETQADNERAGDQIGDTIGRRIRDRIRERVRGGGDDTTIVTRSGGTGDSDTDRERDRRTIGDWIRSGFEAASGWTSGFGDKVSAFFSGDLISMIVKAVAVGGLATALAPVIGAAITSAVLLAVGGGVIAAGIISAFKDPRIAGAANDLKTKLSKMFEEFGKPFRGPVANFLEGLSRLLDKLSPKFQALAKSFAPVVDQLGQGFLEMLENAMPGILEAAEASKPLFETLAKHAPEIGRAISKFFSIIAEQGDDANRFFDDLLSFIEDLLPVIAGMIAAFTSAYNYISDFVHGAIRLFGDLWDAMKNTWRRAKEAALSFTLYAVDKLGQLLIAASHALGWIPGIGPKLKAAERRFNEFRRGVNSELSKIRDRDVQVRIRVMGLAAAQAAVSVGQTLKAMGYAHGGIKGMAAGGLGAGLTLVGEHGPELAQIQPGGRVWSNPDTMRALGGMEGGASGEQELVARWEGGADDLVDAIMRAVRFYVLRKGHGNVQIAFGQGR